MVRNRGGGVSSIRQSFAGALGRRSSARAHAREVLGAPGASGLTGFKAASKAAPQRRRNKPAHPSAVFKGPRAPPGRDPERRGEYDTLARHPAPAGGRAMYQPPDAVPPGSAACLTVCVRDCDCVPNSRAMK